MDSWYRLFPRWGSISFLLGNQVWLRCPNLLSPRVRLLPQTNNNHLLNLLVGSLHGTGQMDLGMEVGMEQASHLPPLLVWVWFLECPLSLTQS